jgi:hypothetical protein
MNPRSFSAGLLVALFASAPFATAQIQYFVASANADQEVPPNASTARGWAVVRLDAGTGNVRIFAHQEGIAAPSAAHLHQAAPGVNGPIIVNLAGGPADWTGSGTLSTVQIAAMQAGNTYVNLHSPALPGGEIRGQVVAATSTRFTAAMAGTQEVPPNASNARGTVTAFLHQPDNRVVYMVESNGLTNVTAAHMHQAAAGVNGPVIFALNGSAGTYCGVSAPLSAAQVTTLQANGMYFNIHTTAFPGGEIRGQLLADQGDHFVAPMDSAAEVPPNGSPGQGSACLIIDPNGVANIRVSFAGLTGAPTAAHIHRAAAGVNGPVIFALAAAGPGLLTATFTPTPAQLADARADLWYVNIHTAAFPGGEIRGQLGAAELPTTYGGGCPGSNSVRPEIGATGFPCLGAGFGIDLYGAIPAAFSVVGIGFSRDIAGGFPLPLAFTTAGLAAPNCYFLTDLASTASTFSDANGCATFRLNVPLLPVLRGTTFYSQWFVFDGAANAAGIVASNGQSAVIQ